MLCDKVGHITTTVKKTDMNNIKPLSLSFYSQMQMKNGICDIEICFNENYEKLGMNTVR